MPVGANTLAYNSLWQVRNDTWSSLEEAAAQLVMAGTRQHPVEQLTEAVTELLNVLGPIERFCAFPGVPAFERARHLFAAGKYDQFAALVSGIDRALATDSFRSGQVGDPEAEDEAFDHTVHPVEQSGTVRPYFEVLVVEDLTERQESLLREELRRWRRPDDAFVYEIVVVPSLDDAVTAVRLNYKLQACVVRRRFTHRSLHGSSSLWQFVDTEVSDDLMEHSPDERAQVLARTMARIRPELDLYLMTEISVRIWRAGSATTSGASSTLGKAHLNFISAS